MKRYTFAVDWDGTCVENAWPEMGKWLPGAVEALCHLDSIGTVVIHTCRVAPVDIDGKTWRNKGDVHESVQGILDVLDEVGLGHLEVWTEPWKPSALVYIDDRALRFDNNWYEILDTVDDLVDKGVDYTIGGVTEAEGPTRARCDVVGDRTCECPIGPCPLGFDPDIHEREVSERDVSEIQQAARELGIELPDVAPCLSGCTDPECEIEVEDDPRIEFVSLAKDFVIDPDVLEQIRSDPLYRRVVEMANGRHDILDCGPKVRFVDPETGGEKEESEARFDLVPPDALTDLARVYGMGAKKYSANNYLKGYPWHLSIAALERHIQKFKAGEDIDPESGLSHLAHAAWQCFTLLVFAKRELGTDDRMPVKSC